MVKGDGVSDAVDSFNWKAINGMGVNVSKRESHETKYRNLLPES